MKEIIWNFYISGEILRDLFKIIILIKKYNKEIEKII